MPKAEKTAVNEFDAIFIEDSNSPKKTQASTKISSQGSNDAKSPVFSRKTTKISSQSSNGVKSPVLGRKSIKTIPTSKKQAKISSFFSKK